MNEPLIDIERVFQDIAGITPSSEATARALARAQAAVAEAPRSPRSWLWPLSIAAVLIMALAASIPLVLPRRVSAQQTLATTLKTTAAYKGWVHLTMAGKRRADWNTVNGDVVSDYSNASIQLIKPRDGENIAYLRSTSTIFIGTLDPNYGRQMQDAAQSMPLDFAELIANIEANVGRENVTVKQSVDRGMDRFDIIVPPTTVEAGRALWKNARWMNPHPPSTVWVDPKTKLLREMDLNGLRYGLAYGAPEYESIYDAGAPRDAKIVDNRLSPETRAAYERVARRPELVFPDGVLVSFTQSAGDNVNGKISLSYRSGNQWVTRHYAGTLGPPEEGKVQWVEDQKDTTTLLARMARVLPQSEEGGDGKTSWQRNYDPKTGEIWHNEFVGDGNVMTSVRTPGERLKSSDRPPIVVNTFNQPLINPTYHLELITSPDRPGLAAFRLQNIAASSRPKIREQWFDPAHDDRGVEAVITTYSDETRAVIMRQSVSRAKEYATLPDGRTFLSASESNYYEPDAAGKLQPAELPENLGLGDLVMPDSPPGRIWRRFFPGAKLPEIPKKTTP